ncbi:putative ribonuclease H protein [Senna tora]|uniref:Putative ribonuclease H protein n=1 Tax=Senna tora TaxID=362788 RepID=A0A834T421_9FABA|nr:putative ribonuclease H protein [Senna tora]
MKGLVWYNLAKPIRKGVNLGNVKDGIFWVDYRFEKIPKCCYSCGIFGHDEEECVETRLVEEGNKNSNGKDLGPWLKARTGGRKVVWPGTDPAGGSRKELGEKRSVGMVKKVEAEELLEKLSRMTMKEQVKSVEDGRKEEAMLNDVHKGAEMGASINVSVETDTVCLNPCVENQGVGVMEDMEAKRVMQERQNVEKGEVMLLCETMEENVNSLCMPSGGKQWKRLARNMGKGSSSNIMEQKTSVRRVIGDGRTTGIWKDPWVPSDVPMLLTKPNSLITEAEYVSELLVENGTRWNEDKLGVLFDVDTCQRILSIPIDVDLRSDRWIWDFNRNGQYTVKMGYRKAMAEYWDHFNLGLDVDEEALTRFWKHLWKLPIISKYKVFLWRACRGILPTVEALEGRGMEINEPCIMCNNAPEDAFHALIDCPELQLMWVHANFDYSSRFYHANILEWLVVEAGEWRDEQIAYLAVAVFHAWERRNKKKFANELIKVEELWPKVERMMEEFQMATFTDGRNIKEPQTFKWEKPEYPFMKLNVDAAGSKSGGGAMGGLLRDATGGCEGVFMNCVRFPSDAILLEATAIKKGLELAKMRKCTHIQVECDSRIVVDMLHSPCDQVSTLNAICGSTSGRSMSWICGCEAIVDLMYESEKGVNGNLIQRTVMETPASRLVIRFANSRAETKWPIPGEGMKMSSDFFI